jgi:hypothetical protein
MRRIVSDAVDSLLAARERAGEVRRTKVPQLKMTISGDKEFLERMRAMAPRVVQVLSVKSNALMFQTQRRIVQKLSGEVLHRRTGILASSGVSIRPN